MILIKERLMKILHLTLFKEYFYKILNGTKVIEYRESKPYWNRIFIKNQGYTHVKFRNGYSKNAPEMIVEILFIKPTDCWEIHLGQVLNFNHIDYLLLNNCISENGKSFSHFK